MKKNDNELLLPNGKLITLNEQQYEGIEKIRAWLKSDANFFTLSGYAGTGKSTILKKILDEYRGGVCVSAPTHKALKVVVNTTNKEGKTLQSLTGLRPDVMLEDFNPNSPIFRPIAIPKILNYNLIPIDESSMINKGLYDLIFELVDGSRTKILFIGDKAQIPPVGEKESHVFSIVTENSHHLTKVERQSDDNPILIMCDALRNNLDTITSGITRRTSFNGVGEGVMFTLDKKAFRDEVLSKFKSDEYKKDIDYAKLIAWKNGTVMMSNKIIRTELFGIDSEFIEVGDVLMGYRTITAENQKTIIIQNSADYRVVEKSKLIENSYGIFGYDIKLREELARGVFNFFNIFIIDVDNHDNLHQYAEMHDFLRDMAKVNKTLWRKYYSFRRNNMLMVVIDKYRNGIDRKKDDIIVKDLDYGFAITAHKSQGSTYTNCFIMENDINDNWVLKERNQIKYVAMSRASKNAFVLTTKLDDK